MLNISGDIKQKDELVEKLILFIIWPFAAFIYSLKDAASRSSYVIYFLFGVALCWHMDTNFSLGAHYDDLQGIMSRFRDFNMTWDQLKWQFNEYFGFTGRSEKELYGISMMWFVKQYTNNPHTYFALSAVIYLIFFLNCLKRITSDPNFDNSVYCLIILLLFVLPRDIITVQNPRYCTAMWMAVMGTFNYFLADRNRQWNILWIVFAPLFHSGLWAYAIIFTIGQIVITSIDRKIWWFYLCSIPFSFVSYDLISKVDIWSLPIPDNFKLWISWHFNEESVSHLRNNTGASGFFWIGQGFAFLKKIAYIGLLFVLKRYIEEIEDNRNLYKFFLFFVFYAAVVNFIQIVPVLGQRSYFVTRILSMYFWIKMVYPRNNKYLLFVLAACSWEIFQRYLYNGAVNSSVPRIFFVEPLPNIIMDYWDAV